MSDRFIQEGIQESEEPEVAPDGEYNLTIVTAEEKLAKSGRPMITVMLRIDSDDGVEYAPVFHNLLSPTGEEMNDMQAGDKEAEQKVKRFQRDNKRFCQAFDIEIPWSNTADDFVGQTGRCFLGHEEYEGQLKNTLKLPRLSQS